NRGKDLSWEPLRAERVVEVAYDHLQGSRFRHATTFKRWRPDKPPEACRYDQLETTAPFQLEAIFRSWWWTRAAATVGSRSSTRRAPRRTSSAIEDTDRTPPQRRSLT